MSQSTRDASLSVLLVDDSEALASEHRRLCSEVPGLTVVGVARNGAEAIRLVKVAKPDLVLLDLMMPDIDGFVALRLLTKGLPGTRIVVVSSRADEPEVKQQCLDAGAVGVCCKPLSRGALEQIAASERARREAGSRVL
jgi:DNA-binding NarL/FixJ family response regulator